MTLLKSPFFFILLLLFLPVATVAQTKVFASGVVAESYVETSAGALDQDLSTRARIKANSGYAFGIGQYSGYLELQFANTLSANTTSYVKITTDDPLLPYLVGGTIGDLLADIASAFLIGQQEFSVDVKNSAGTVVLHGDSQDVGELATSRLKIVQNAAGEYFIMITPDQPYKRIRLTNRLGALFGFNTTKRLDVYEAYYITNPAPCADAAYTSFGGAGITMDVLQLGLAGVHNPEHAIDASATNFSTLSLGLLGLGAYIEQTVYFEGPSQAADQFGVRIKVNQGLLTSVIANNVTIIASNGGTVVQSKSLAELLTLNSLLLNGGQVTSVPMAPGAPVDRITVRLSTPAGIPFAQAIDFYGVSRTAAPMPVISQNYPVCEGGTATLIATGMAGSQMKWYGSGEGGATLATTNSGQAFTTPPLSADTTYYVSQVSGSCESLLRPVTVQVIITPGAGTIAGEQTACLGSLPAALSSVNADSGANVSYRWESSVNGSDWTVIIGANQAGYQPTNLTVATLFRRYTIRGINGVTCESPPSNVLKITTRNCKVISNPMIRQRIKNGA